MADGDSADTHIRKSPLLLDREIPVNKSSYFWSQQVVRCVSEGHKLLGDKLREEEKEAKIVYHKTLSTLFDGEAQIDAPFRQLIFDSDEATSLDGLFDDLATVAHTDTAKTRLLDMLFVTHQYAKLLEVQKSINAPYDLYDANAAAKLGRMTTFANLLNNSKLSRSDNGPASVNLAMTLSMLATGQEPLVETALLTMSKAMNLHWDALILARIYYKPDHEISRKVRDAWVEAVMDDPEKKFRMMNIARSLKTSNLKDVARSLTTDVTNKTTANEMILAYRCLAIFLGVNSSQMSALERKVEEAEAITQMRSIFVTMLTWGKIDWAKHSLADVAMRAPLGDIPSEICQIGMTCFVELVEILLKTQGIGTDNVSEDAPFTVMAKKWRSEMIGGHAEMSKLKTENLGGQKVMYSWMHQLGLALREPLMEQPNPNTKMECVFLATEFLHEILRWAAVAPEGEPLRLLWPGLANIKLRVKDESIVMPPEDGQRGRTSSVASARSTATIKDDFKKQQTAKGFVKQEQPHAVPVQDVRNQNEPIIERKQQSKERGAQAMSGDSRRNEMQSKTEQQQPNNRGMANQRGGGELGFGQPNVPSNSSQWQRGQTQDYRMNQQNTGGGSEFHGAGKGGAEVLNKLLNSAGQNGALLAQTYSSHIDGQFSVPPPPFITTSSSSSGVDLTAKMEEYCSSKIELSSVLPSISLEALSATAPVQTADQYLAPLAAVMEQEQRKSQAIQSSLVAPKSPSSPAPTFEQIKAVLDESMKRNGSATQLTASWQSPPTSSAIPQQPTMGTAAVNKARERRSVESGQPMQQETVVSQPPADSQYEKLMEMEKKENGDEQPITPDPAEMNKLFTGNHKGQSTLPPNLSVEEGLPAAAVAQSTIMQPHPPPSLMAAAVPSDPSPSPSLELIKLTPPESIVLPTENRENGGYQSTSSESILSPIAEASQDTLGTYISESDGTGLMEETTDTVFEDYAEPNMNPLQVDVGVQPQQVESGESPFHSQLTPRLEDVCSNSNSNSQSRYASREDVMRQADSPALSPLVVSPLAKETSVSESAEQTAVPTTSDSTEVRREAEDENQIHLPILTPDPSVSDEQQLPPVHESVETEEAKQEETAQMQTSVPQEASTGSVTAPTIEPLQQQMQQQPAMPATYSAYLSSQSTPAPIVAPNEMQQLCPSMETPAQLQQQQSTMQQAQPVIDMSVPPPVSTRYTSLFSEAPPAVPPPATDPLMSAVSVMPSFDSTVTAHSSQSATSVQQMGQQSMIEQLAPAPVEQQHSQFVEQLEEDTTTQMQQATLTTEMVVAREAPSDSASLPNSQQLNVDCTESEVQERVTSCGVSYKFSHPVTDEAVDQFVSSTVEQEQMLEPVQEPFQESAQQPAANALDSFLSMMDSTNTAMGGSEGGTSQEGIFTATMAESQPLSLSSSVTNMQSDGPVPITKDEIDEHAALRRQEASEYGGGGGDMASEIGSSIAPHPFPLASDVHSVPSIPSTALTTPEPYQIEQHQQQQAFNYSNEHSNNGGYGGEEWAMETDTTSIQMSTTPSLSATPASGDQQLPVQHHQPPQQFIYQPTTQPIHGGGDITHQMSANCPPPMTATGDHSVQQQQQPQSTFQPTFQSGDITPQHVPPVYVDPFSQPQQKSIVQPVQQQQPPALYQKNQMEHPPVFGTGGQNTQQQPQQQNSFGDNNPRSGNFTHGRGQGQGNQRPYNANRLSNDRGQRHGRGGSRGGGYGGNSGGAQSGGGFGGNSGGGGGQGQAGFAGFGNNQHGNQQQQQQSASGFSGGDNGQQKNFQPRQDNMGGAQDVRRGGSSAPFRRGVSSGR